MVGSIKKPSYKKNLIFFLNLVVLLVLQPNLPIRNLRFWLPSVIIIITIVSWIIIRDKVRFNTLSIVKPISAIAATYLLLIIVTKFGIFNNLYNQLKIINLLIFFGILFLLITLNLITANGSRANYWIFVIIILFVFLKTPQLSLMISKGLRTITDQSVELATHLDISWLGFSYIAFRLIHTLREHEKGALPDVDLVEYFNYVTFFPTMVAGPIDRFDHFQKSFQNPDNHHNMRIIYSGQRISIGLFKKFVVADLLSLIALNEVNASQIHSSIWMWISVYAYAFLIFFDFSGYTDIAIGMACLLGIEIPENFSHPYAKKNLTLFWNSWHMTLTQFFRTYYFNPLARYLRTGKRKWSVWLIILTTQISTMVLIGFWHGIIINFVLWGLWHGIGLFIQNRWSNSLGASIEKKFTSKLSNLLINGVNIFLTFNFVSVGWVFFVLPNVQSSISVLKVLVGAG